MPVMTSPTPASEQLASGLGGAIGCSYRRAHNDLIFVEFAGRLSQLQLVRPPAATVSSGTATIHGTWYFDFDDGVEGASGDVFWEQHTATVRSLDPQGGAKIVNLGAVSYTGVTPATLQSLAYGTTPVVGNADATNQLVVGDVFAVLTSAGNYAKAQVLAYGYDLQIKWTTYRLASGYHVLGSGYTQPEDVVVTADELHAYVTERSGDLVRVSLGAANRASATVVASGLNAPHQIALDEDHDVAYVVEFASPGRVLRIDLGTGAATPVVTTIQNGIGLLVTSDGRFAYVTEQLAGGQGQISRFELATGRREVLYTGSPAPLFFLRWADEGEGSFLVTERDPANQVLLVDLTQATPTVTTLAATAFRPSSTAVLAGNDVLVCCDGEIDELELGSDSIYRAVGDIALGIGHIPSSTIDQTTGCATTDPHYLFPVKDAPFGGTLPVMVNHDKAWALGARYYKVFVDGSERSVAFGDYKWSTSTNRFEWQPASTGAFLKVRSPAELWFNHFLGGLLPTGALSNALHTIEVRLYASASAASEIGHGTDAGRHFRALIDNRWPSASIDRIVHDGSPVGTCAIVDSGSTFFSFELTASDPDAHLKSWSLSALWGDNESATVAADAYESHLGASPAWNGPTAAVPGSPWNCDTGTPTSKRCAHTFYLDVWDRVIDGWSYIHHATYHKSITIML